MVLSSSSAPLLPSPRRVLASLVDAIASIPLQQPAGPAQQQQQQEARTNPLRLVPLSHRYLIVTLHVLFPGLVLPALDLLDRGLVARVVLECVGHHGYDNTAAAGSAPQEATAAVKPGDGGGGVRAHATAPLPPPLPLPQEPESNTNSNIKKPEARRNEAPQFFLVRSAQQQQHNQRRRRRGGGGGGGGGMDGAPTPGAPLPAEATYMVRLGAWNCTCAAFAFAAVSGTTADTATAHTQNGPAAATETEAHGPKDAELVVEPEEAEWSFGGMSLGGYPSEGEGEGRGDDAAPMCKHLLACMLGERWQAALGSYVVERTVTQDEMVGIVANV
ncbi:hypothetical protein B0T24DRAFT_242441 [Lasiosphaeria ovina]|uniref:SWIM-type domain-containing protein n=1 Tax=Lasiosphaeria ovina TaxID=92902 RepID=A0AAE0KAX5_9PEZI|nr:hypothetical protein B0T24DRAFT_242441 [Lasiosphaeria ovina]